MKNETIVDRVVERLKLQPLGDLITEEDLHDIVKTAIPRVFFEKRTVMVGSGYHQEKKTIEPLIVEVMRELMQASAREAVKDWLDKNTDVTIEHWRKVLDAGILTYVQKLQDDAATLHVRQGLQVMLNAINAERQKAGLPPMYL